MLKLLPLAAVAALVAVPAPGASPTGNSDAITVRGQSPLTMRKWVNRLTTDLERGLARPRTTWFREVSEGYAVVEFRCGQAGRAEEIVLTMSSNDRQVNRTALRAVERLDTLHPMPSGLQAGQKVRANIVIAADPDGLEDLTRRLRKATARHTAAAAASGEQVVVLNAGMRVQG